MDEEMCCMYTVDHLPFNLQNEVLMNCEEEDLLKREVTRLLYNSYVLFDKYSGKGQ
jgi:hypothetical protein